MRFINMEAMLAIVFIVISRTVAQVCDFQNSVELTDRKYNGIIYQDGEFYVDNETKVERGCVCLKKTCIRKCCPIGQAYDESIRQCVDFHDEFNPPIWKGAKVIPDFNITKEFNILIDRMNCSSKDGEFRIAVSPTASQYRLKKDGKLYITIEDNIPSDLVYRPDKYCMDTFISGEETEKSIKFNGLICFKVQPKEVHLALNATCMLISCFFMMLTVGVYNIIPELRNLHGMIMTAYLLSFFVAFLFLGIMDILLLNDSINQTCCTGMTFVIYFSMLAAFFWLNVMCYDLYAKFRITNMAHGFQESNTVRFLKYCTYAFGTPTLLTILLAILEFSHLSQSKYLPNLRQQGCFIDKLSRVIYLFVPILFVWAANLVLFGLIARRIGAAKKQTKMLNKKDSQRLWLYIKLFIVTGPTWIFEIISGIYPHIPYLFQFTDAYNILVGFIIFVIFVWKKKIWLLLKKRFNMA